MPADLIQHCANSAQSQIKEYLAVEDSKDAEPDPVDMLAVDPVDPFIRGPDIHDRHAGGQLDLFDARHLRLQNARLMVARGQLGRASREYDCLLERYVDDPVMASEARRVRDLEARLAKALVLAPMDRVAALIGMAEELRTEAHALVLLRRVLLRRAAMDWQRACGDAFELSGRLPCHMLMEAGEFELAEASLGRALARQGRHACLVFAWADLAVLRGDVHTARAAYLEALLRDPFDRARCWVRDSEIRSLPDMARHEFDIAEEPIAWCAPVGMVTGVLPSLPMNVAMPMDHRGTQPGDRGVTVARRVALMHARSFVAALQQAGVPGLDRRAVVEARRIMKQLQPILFRAYLERIATPRGIYTS